MPRIFQIVLLLISVQLHAQPLQAWERVMGGSLDDYAYQIEATADGGYVMIGTTTSSDGDIRSHFNERDIWVVKLCSKGLMQWERCLGGNGTDFGQAIRQTSDRGFIVTGGTYSKDEMVNDPKGSCDAWVVKLTEEGMIEWEKSYGGTDFDIAFDIELCPDGGYVIAANSRSNDGDVEGHHGFDYYFDYWIFKINYEGKLLWSKNFGGSLEDQLNAISVDSQGNILAVGFAESADMDVSSPKGAADVWLVKLNASGDFLWEKTYGGSKTDRGFAVVDMPDGGFTIAGYSTSDDGDITETTYRTDYWVFKIDTDGVLEWQKTLGGSRSEFGQSISLTSEGNLIIGGHREYTYYKPTDSTTSLQGYEFWMVQLDETGSIYWEQTGRVTDRNFMLGAAINKYDQYVAIGYAEQEEGIGEEDDHRDIIVLQFNTGNEASKTICYPPDLYVFPNPAGHQIVVEHNGQRMSSVEIYDMNGAIIGTRSLPSFSNWRTAIDISELTRGMYHLKLFNTDGKISYIHFVKGQ